MKYLALLFITAVFGLSIYLWMNFPMPCATATIVFFVAMGYGAKTAPMIPPEEDTA